MDHHVHVWSCHLETSALAASVSLKTTQKKQTGKDNKRDSCVYIIKKNYICMCKKDESGIKKRERKMADNETPWRYVRKRALALHNN